MLHFLSGIVLILMGMTMLLKPRRFFELMESWKYDGGSEPSKMFLFSTRFGGVMCTLAGIAGLAVPFLS